jgi:hypothetical protein
MDGIERQLLKYQPAGPPAELRDRVLESVAGQTNDSSWRWAAAAAAVFLAAILYTQSDNEHAAIRQVIIHPDGSREAVVRGLARSLGGGPLARYRAERVIARDPVIR